MYASPGKRPADAHPPATVGVPSVLVPPPRDAVLMLEDGSSYPCAAAGARVAVAGEIVFNTGMVGYAEALTDPSYRGQVLVFTFPLIGNYGVPDVSAVDALGISSHLESGAVQATAAVVGEAVDAPSHWQCVTTLGAWMEKAGVPLLFGLDTRALTQKIREKGAMRAKVEFPGCSIAFLNPYERNLVAEVSCRAVRVVNPSGKPRIAAVDCGMKYNIVRYFARKGACVMILPFDTHLPSFIASEEAASRNVDGIFISNGPGDPAMCTATIASLREVIAPAIAASEAAAAKGLVGADLAAATRSKACVIPVFGICLGNQLLALAAGARTYKMKYGNRGMNQPAVDLRTTKCYITPQNHGFAVDTASLPAYWKPFFINANDHSNEGIIHSFLPYFSVQFHPEANGGPLDTAFLFDQFLELVSGRPPSITTIDGEHFLARTRMHTRKVLLLGSGGLSIGQAGEFDYSGSQAIKALKEEGVEVILINPNIATVQTSKGMADRVYFLPVTPQFVLEVIKKERPDAILISMGGQTALNVGLALEDSGDLAKYHVRVLGTPTTAIRATEDREIFSRTLAEIGETVALSSAATGIEEAVRVAERIGYPVLVRAAYALGGLGSGFAHNEAELRELAARSFAASDQILIDQDLRGWKEIEYEVVRDGNDNCITVCNMENFDPLGVHTGDSIVVAPSQTLSNQEYFMLRAVAQKVVRHLKIVGECNIQYALSPTSDKYCIIEVNARLSRSSALASKATGYPLAYVATKLALGYDLVALRNSVTKTTTACFEPSLDYVVVKVPRWDLKKFGSRVDTRIGSAMKSVGEVMSIGRSFEEAIQKAVRMVNPALDGFGVPPTFDADAVLGVSPAKMAGGAAAAASPSVTVMPVSFAAAPVGGAAAASAVGAGGRGGAFDATGSPRAKRARAISDDSRFVRDLDEKLRVPTNNRLLDIAVALDVGYSVDRIHELSKIDRWFLHKLKRIMDMSRGLEQVEGLHSLTSASMRYMKEMGFSDKQIARKLHTSELAVRRTRIAQGIVPYVKQIDTLAAEYPAQTNYLYMTYNGSVHDLAPSASGTIVLGGGPYCIGSSVEFDWCAVSCIRTLRAAGQKAIVVNCNPETVSTDYDESDRLYFEELTMERVLDIYEREAAAGVVVSVGGQIPNNLAMPLHRQGVRILGTSPEDIDKAEDRNKFSKLLDTLNVDQPPWRELSSIDEIKSFAAEVGYPVIVRPSYVLSGAAMRVVTNEEQLRDSLLGAAIVNAEHPVVVSKFILNAKEVEFDGVAKAGRILNYAISEHVENAGVHSGDATLVLPAQKLYVETIRQVKKISQAIAKALNISGPFNMQFMSRENDVKVIECNLRASRTFPFISKTFDFNFIALATRIMAGLPSKAGTFSLVDLDFVGIKAPQFSFTRLAGADPTLGVEMMSTGEVACFGADMYEAFLLSMMAAGFKLPTKTRNILITLGSMGKAALVEAVQRLHRLGFNLFATPGTRSYLLEQGAMPPESITEVHKPRSGLTPNVTDMLTSHQLDLVINDAESGDRESVTDGYLVRRTAVDFGVSLITNVKCAILLTLALERVGTFNIRSMEEYYGALATDYV